MNDCVSCDNQAKDTCAASKLDCGHHCNHAWTHDECCWCGEEFGEEAGES